MSECWPTSESVKPLTDTWGYYDGAAIWGLMLSSRPNGRDARSINAWYARTVAVTLEALSPVARAVVSFGTISDPSAAPVEMKQNRDESEAAFRQRVSDGIQSYPAPIFDADLHLDWCVYVRTEDSPVQPVRAWVSLGDRIRFVIGSGDDEPSAYFHMDHTLFRSCSMENDDNPELASLNQPFLELVLRRMEAALGPIDEVEGIGGVWRYGFNGD